MASAELKQQTLHVSGMTCMDCAKTISNYLIKQQIENPKVEFLTGEVVFEEVENEKLNSIITGINNLGYQVIDVENPEKRVSIKSKFIFSLILTIPLLIGHLFSSIFFLQNPFLQLGLATPIFFLGIIHFGKSAFSSIKMRHPNMDVLIVVGASSAYLYSIISFILFFKEEHLHHRLFFETSSSIICFVLLGQLIEQMAVAQTTNSLKDLTAQLPQIAKRISLQFGKEIINEIRIDEVNKFDLLLVVSGDKIPVDGEIYEGIGLVDESMISGESFPLEKTIGSKVFGGTILNSGSIKLRAESKGDKTILAEIIKLVKAANNQKPSIQKIGDLVSGYFVVVVILISLLAFPINYFFTGNFTESFLRSMAVLVISCPCAMGLATPTAVMVGIGLATKNGILIKGGDTIEALAKIDTVVFDKTGTLTTGNFKVCEIKIVDGSEISFVKNILFSLESFSNHPIAISLRNELSSDATIIKLENVREAAGLGIEGQYQNSMFSLSAGNDVSKFKVLNLYRDKSLVAEVFVEDEPKQGIPALLGYLKSRNTNIYLLSGDRKSRVESFAKEFGFDTFFYEKKPDEKLLQIQSLSKENKVAMIGDGINDAPALALASVGIALADANSIAINSSQVVILRQNKLEGVADAFRISNSTYTTIKQNLFWAFLYNIVAIPIAASGGLSPMLAAFSMAFSDVVVIGNSLLLKVKTKM